MIPLKKAIASSVGKKYFMSVSGILLTLFIIVHLLGNFTLYFGGHGRLFNSYTAHLESWGPFLYVIEIGLLAVFLLHIITALIVSAKNRKARAVGYEHSQVSKGGPSHMSPASRNMIITGLVLLAFLIIHVLQFRFIGHAHAHTITLPDGHKGVDLYAVVVHAFKNPFWVGFYSIVMIFLGFHLSHGFWSAWQSLGAMNPRWTKPVYALGILVALLLGTGFFFIPIYIFIFAKP